MTETINRDPHLATDGSVVGFYEREFFPFSNFSSFQVQWRDERWATSEHAYQAAHFFDTDPTLAERIRLATSAHEAFVLAKANADKAPGDWDEQKVGIMAEIVRAKCMQHEYIRKQLGKTGTLYMVEDSPKDSFWGWGADRQGRNELGKIWMNLREELRASGELQC